MNVRELKGGDAAALAFPILRELRPHVDPAAFLEVLENAPGYRIFGAFEDGGCVGVLGCRVLLDFVHGRHLYVDDLVVTEKRRSGGVGAQLLAFAAALAREEKCIGVRLCTGTENEGGRRFYERHGYRLRSVAYKKALDEERRSFTP